ncbi:type II toxin-antitoxin system PemK/MazF family toxin [Ketobacter sp. MCCC 1A13808]|uniref:type II toxin-antitoxin system PemK/MazF family toxin n=1 Tax=Ketobacter sp. MCCC 1A13808 TaxID=2602738 RepID=UPI0012EB2CC5|nr:type II toxin-antitoxin system PemK/MazF family toxin [Ketobacter sp. MCCC 1A13808]MVF13326.1 type II toxin-antitoxin system PemK/MazF family toxin [Ketobacter sp. MCCC 1A13808]
MPSTTSYKFGDVVLVAFPFTNLQASKKRPAVVISSAHYQQQRPDVILMAITSQVRPSQQFGECLLQDWQQAGLLKPSVLKPLIATLQQNQVVKVMGQLSATDQSSLQNVLQDILYC